MVCALIQSNFEFLLSERVSHELLLYLRSFENFFSFLGNDIIYHPECFHPYTGILFYIYEYKIWILEW